MVRKTLSALVVLAGVAALAACAGPSTGSAPVSTAQNPLQALQSFTVTDLQAADADAATHGDTLAHTCYAALIPAVQDAQVTAPQLKGAFSAFQASRDAATLVQAGIPQNINVACAPLVLDASATVVGLAAKLGVTLALPATPGATLLP